MIRRQDGSDFLLINQHDHALVAGQMAELFGNEQFPAPQPLEQTLAGISLHDCGWPLHDNKPTLNPDHFPLDVFETSRSIAFKVWTACVEGATRQDAYAGLLVSLHVLSLSVMATEHARPEAQFDLGNPQDRFAVIKFQQRELERQENLRAQLGLRSEKSAHHTVAKGTKQGSEDQLQFNFALLQVMDQLSLAGCCTKPPMETTRDLPMELAGGSGKVRFTLAREGNDVLISPWPFSLPAIDLMIPACRIPASAYKNDAELHGAMAKGSSEIITVAVRPAGAAAA